MSLRASCRLILLLGLSLAVAGCSSGSGLREGLTLPQAKEDTQAVEREIAAAVPAQLVEAVDQHRKGALLDCDGRRGQSWSGVTVVSIIDDPPPNEVIPRIVEQLAPKGWPIREDQDDDGDDLLYISGSFGATWIVRYDRPKGTLRITSASECFRLPLTAWRDADL